MKSIKLVYVIAIIVLCGLISIVLLSVIKYNSKNSIQGRVIDEDTSTPISGVIVSVNNRGWGFQNGSLVWDKDYIYQAFSDHNGNFSIEYKVGSSAHVKAVKEGYATYDQWHTNNSTITIKLKKRS